MSPRLTAALLAAILALALAACGDDEDGGGSAGYGSGATSERGEATATTETAPETTTTGTETGGGEAAGGGAEGPAGESPEDQPGGAGDEVPATSQALIVGRDGGFHPTVVRVPPFIAIRVQLRSADGVEYELGAMGKTVEAGGEIESAATTFEGLRSGDRLVLKGPQGKVMVIANAEPGP
jgi:hypothetical protein